jgi:hypothetical protein
VSVRYIDASALVKIAVVEPDSDALRRFLSDRTPLVSSALTRAEAVRAVRHKGPEALVRVRQTLLAIDLVPVDDEILDAAGLLDPRILRTLDAIHLATALALGDDLHVLVSHDERMLRSAALLGLPTASPG